MNELNKENENQNDNKLIKCINEQFLKINFKKSIKCAIEYYKLYDTLKKEIIKSEKKESNSNYFSGELYLIKEDWISNYKKIFLYKEIYRTIINNIDNIYNKDSIIIDNLIKKFEIVFFNKNKHIKEIPHLNSTNQLKIEYKINNDETEFTFYYQYEIINQIILENIIMDKLELNNKIKPHNFIINNKKIIIQHEEKNNIIIGILNNDNNIFIPEIVLNYNKESQVKSVFNNLKIKELPNYENYLNLDNNELNNEEIKSKIYKIDKIKYLKLIEEEKETINEFDEKNSNENIINTLFSDEQLYIIPNYLKNDIQSLIKYFIFSRKIKRAINDSNKNNNFYYYPNCHVINSDWMDIFKFYFFYEKLDKLTNEEMNSALIRNNYLDNEDECLVDKVFPKIVKEFNNSHNDKDFEIINLNLENEKRFELNYDFYYEGQLVIKYPSIIEIIDERIYNNIIQRNNINLKNQNSKCEIIVNSEKIILKYDNPENDNNKYLCLLIGKLNINNNKFISEFLLIFTHKDKREAREKIFNNFKKINFMDIIVKKEKNFITVNLNQSENKINTLVINPKENEFNFDKYHIGDKMIKLFFILYLYNEEILKTVKKDIKENGFCYYYLINKDWMQIYKEYYNYNEISSFLDEIKKLKECSNLFSTIISLLNNNSNANYDKFLDVLIQNIPKNLLKSIEKRKMDQKILINKLKKNESENNYFQINTNIYKTNKAKYFGENEIISKEFFDLFNQLETSELKESLNEKSSKIKCLIGENKIYIILDEYNLLNIGYIQNNIFKPTLLIYYYAFDDYNNFILKLTKSKFEAFIKNYDLTSKEYLNIYNSDNKNIGEIANLSKNYINKIKNLAFSALNIKIPIIKSDAQKIIKLIIYLNIFKKEMEFSEKIKEKKYGYLVNYEFINLIKKTKLFMVLDDYIKNNNNIKKIINQNSNKEINYLLELIIQEIDEKTIKKINETENINKHYNSYNINYQKLTVNNVNISFVNNFIIFNEEIYKLFKAFLKNNESVTFYSGDERIFIPCDSILKKGYINVYKNNEKGLELDLILFFEKGIDGEEIIKTNDSKCIFIHSVFENDYISPIFDPEQNKIGIVYKYDSSIKNYQLMNINYINFEIRKIFLLYLNYYKLKKNVSSKNNSKLFHEYYIVNYYWIQKYKNYYEFDNIYKLLNQKLIINKIFEVVIEEENDKITDKIITIIAKKIPKFIFEIFSENDKNFIKRYKNEERKIPLLSAINYYYKTEKTLFYFHNFELISSDIYECIFKDLDKNISNDSNKKLKNILFWKNSDYIENETEKVKCIFDKERIMIQLSDKRNDADNKYVIYIGKLNPDFIFEPELFLLYDDISLMSEHVNNIIFPKGINSFFYSIHNLEDEVNELKYNNKIYGIAIKNG